MTHPDADFTCTAAALVAANDRVPEQRAGEDVPKRLLDLAAYGVWVELDAAAATDYALCEQIAEAALRPLIGIIEVRGSA